MLSAQRGITVIECWWVGVVAWPPNLCVVSPVTVLEDALASDGPLEHLMQRVAEGDEGATADLVHALRPRVLRFLRQLGARRDVAEDLCQETLLRLWLARRRYRPKAKLMTFVLTIAYRCYLNWRESAGVRREVVDDAVGERLVEPSRNPEEWILAAVRRGQIRDAVNALPDGQREVFQMAHLDQMAYAEIAEILGVPVGTVKSRMWSAIRSLRAGLRDSLAIRERTGEG